MKRMKCAAGSILVFCLLAGVVAAPVVAEELPIQLREALEAALKKRVGELDKDDKRGIYSTDFKRVDDATFTVTMHVDSVTDDRRTTERFLLTLKNTGGDSWTVDGEALKDTYDGLIRDPIGNETFHSFDKLSLEDEGLSVTVDGGDLYVDYYGGQPARIEIVGRKMSFDYTVPAHADFRSKAAYTYVEAQEPEALAFEPERLVVLCDPAACNELLSSAAGLRDATADSVDPQIRKRWQERTDNIRENRKDNPFGGFNQPLDPEHRYRTISLKKKGRDHYLWHRVDNFYGWDVAVGVSGFGQFIGHYSEELVEGGIAMSELERRVDRFSRDFHLTGLEGEVELAIKNSETLSGNVTFTLEMKRDLKEIAFFVARLTRDNDSDRNPSLIIKSIKDDNGDELTWTKLGSSGGIVVLPGVAPAGSKHNLHVSFENRNGIRKITPSYSAVSRGGWLPFVNFGDFIDDFDLTIRVPAKYTTLGVGKKVEEKIEGAVSVTRWVASSPVNFPTVIFGDYISKTPSFEAKKADGTVIPVTIHADKFGMTSWDIRPKQLPALAEEAANSLNLYRKIFGTDYPHDKLDLVNDPVGPALYGQAPASIVYLGSMAFRGEGIIGSFAGGSTTKFNKSLVAHEVAHQWWGNLVANANSRNYWFVESLAEYASALFVENLAESRNEGSGFDAYLDHVAGWRHEVLDSGHWGSVQGSNTLNNGNRRAAIYAKGPYAFHMLRMTFGDQKVYDFLKQLSQELAKKEIITRDIQSVAEQAFGGSMEWFFDQWIRGMGVPEYALHYTTRRTEDGSYLVEGKIKQRVVAGKEKVPLEGQYFRGVAPVTAVGFKSKKEYPIRLLIEGEETLFKFKIPEEPMEIVFNKNGDILAHDVLVNKDFE